MAYCFSKVTIRTNNTPEGMEKINAVWADITSGKLPLLFDSDHHFQQGISPVSEYSNYATDETGDYDLSIIGVTADFFKEMELQVASGHYQKYDASDDHGDVGACAKMAWEKAWGEHGSGVIKRAFTRDYESTVPAEYTKDGKAHCYLYIALQP